MTQPSFHNTALKRDFNFMSPEDWLEDYREIHNLTQLANVIEHLTRNFIDRGFLKEKPAEYSSAEILRRIYQGASLPEIISLQFETIPTGVKYTLGIDAYHGHGVFERMVG